MDLFIDANLKMAAFFVSNDVGEYCFSKPFKVAPKNKPTAVVRAIDWFLRFRFEPWEEFFVVIESEHLAGILASETVFIALPSNPVIERIARQRESKHIEFCCIGDQYKGLREWQRLQKELNEN